jgi:NAD(P)H dehydrogenase (quinone)
MTQSTFLIAGATGDTGRNVTKILTGQGLPVRALVHREDERSQALRAMGAEVVVGDLSDLDAVRQVMEGIQAAYFVYPIEPGLIEATVFFAQAAKEAGVKSIVNMSQISARSDSKSHAARNHWVAERVFDWSGVPVTHLRPTYFAQWLLYPHFISSIKKHGAISLPFGNGRHAPIAAEDQARVIAAILLDPVAHQGKTYPLYGPVEMDQAGIAAAVGEALGRKVVYQPIEIDEYRARLESVGMPAHRIQHLCAVAVDYRNGIFAGTNNVIEDITGQPPMTVQAFITLHKDAF